MKISNKNNNDSMNKILELKRNYQNEGKKVLKQEFKTFFEKYPFISQIRWAQFTPYFNDGDVCLFNIHDLECTGDFSEFSPDLNEKLNSIREYESDEYHFGDNCSIAILKFLSEKKRWGGRNTPNEHYIRELNEQEKNLIEDYNNLTGIINNLSDLSQELFNEGLVVATKDGFEVSEYEHD